VETTRDSLAEPAINKSFQSFAERWKRATWLSQTVRERRRFVIREALPRPSVASYRLRDTEDVVAIRHHGRGSGAPSSDPWILYEVFRGGDYLWPPEVAARLDSAADALRVVDLGANIGFFSLLVLSRYPTAQITAFEPDPGNVALLRRTLRRNGFDRQTQIIEACAYIEDGVLGFVSGQGGESHVCFDGESATTRVACRDVFPYLRDVDLLKIDIEGGEWPLISDERFAALRPRAIALEYHSQSCPGENAKQEATGRLAEMGYTISHPRPQLAPDRGQFWGAAVLWAHLAHG